MANEKMRAFELDGKRRGIKLDPATWAAIDWLAEQQGVKWAELARRWAELGLHRLDTKGDNLTGIIRSYAIHELTQQTIFAERAEQYADTSAPTWRSIGQCNDDSFDYAIGEARKHGAIEGEQDFGGFELYSGVSEFGNVTYYIRNCMKFQQNIIISTPFKPDEWEKTQTERFGE